MSESQCDTPHQNRALSIREAADCRLFQTASFFEDKRFTVSASRNAVPPILAKAIAEHLCNI